MIRPTNPDDSWAAQVPVRGHSTLSPQLSNTDDTYAARRGTPAVLDDSRCDPSQPTGTDQVPPPDEPPLEATEVGTLTKRRRSTFYVALDQPPTDDSLNLSGCSLDWSANESMLSESAAAAAAGAPADHPPRAGEQAGASSTPIRTLPESRSRVNILHFPDRTTDESPQKEKSKTLPQNLNGSSLQGSPSLRSKNAGLFKSSPKISTQHDHSVPSGTQTTIPLTAKSPRKSLSFIRRSHSTASRSNSLLRSFTSATRHQEGDLNGEGPDAIVFLSGALLQKLYAQPPEEFTDSIRKIFVRGDNAQLRPDQDEDGVHSDTSYEKACRRGSTPAASSLGGQQGHEQPAISRFTNFFSKRSFRANPLKRTKSVTKLDRTKRNSGSGLRGSRSHESLLSSHALISTLDLSAGTGMSVSAVHQSVLGKTHCFQVRGGLRGERFYSCGSRQERDLWIYSLRRSLQPNAEHVRRTDHSLSMWIYEAKGLPAKRRYFCEIHLDQALFGRTSTKMRAELLFWGEHFDFPDIPETSLITVRVFREGDKKKKRDKHTLVGSVRIPIKQVAAKAFCEDWHPILSEKSNSISRSSGKEVIPTLRIKCRYQRIDVLPIRAYDELLHYLKLHYKKICELLEPVIGVKAKEDIGQAFVYLMHAQDMASAFLADVVALDLLRVGDQRLTFRGNSLATKSMEAFLKLVGEQYLQDTLAAPVSQVIESDRDCEVDPAKAAPAALARQQQNLTSTARLVWDQIYNSSRNFPEQLRECFAAFRDRLEAMDRDDMADNLISASIFLRFLCPAILSPSLFNITHELPSDRATRNLTLVAKTLQTLANFTRFQAKEGFMEFLNEFLEEEAPRMKEFLRVISSRRPQEERSVLDWAGHIDQGKQLSVLHGLLVENLTKLPSNEGAELLDLINILGRINQAKESAGERPRDELPQVQEEAQDGSRRGVMRGVLSPGLVDNNIFRFNDPTCHQNQQAFSQHSQSSASISSVPAYSHASERKQAVTHSMEAIVGKGARGLVTDAEGRVQSNTNLSYDGKTTLSGGVRANTLPKNHVASHVGRINAGGNLIQIGLEANPAFVSKSPRPLTRTSPSAHSTRSNHHTNLQSHRLLHDSQQSLRGDAPFVQSIGIPLVENHNRSHIGQHILRHVNDTPTYKMPMNLEDLEDLLAYADENQSSTSQPDVNGNETGSIDRLAPKSHLCSSGYQSISTQSQSSSPVESKRSQEAARLSSGRGGGPLKYQFGGTEATVNAVRGATNTFPHPSQKRSTLTPSSSEERLSEPHPPRKFNAVQIGEIRGESELSMITSSLGRLPPSHAQSLGTRAGSHSRTPRTNPLYYNTAGSASRVDGGLSHSPLGSRASGQSAASSSSRYQRRLSLESARTLSDSSSDTEDAASSSRTSTGGEAEKRRRGSGRSVEHYEKEIQRLQHSMDSMRRKLEDFELRDSNNDLASTASSTHSDCKMRKIISRLITMEEELRREQLKMSLALSHKQKVIEAQGQQIAALDRANNRLLAALSSLRKRYENQNPVEL